LTSHKEVRLDPPLHTEYYNASCTYQNFAWKITKALYHPEELQNVTLTITDVNCIYI